MTKGLTVAGSILGTVQYMSPEQLQGKSVDARSDLFSFGCVLYELLTGKRAFDGENPASVIAAVLERDPAPLEISPPLDRVVEHCLAKDPDRRFQTAIDLKTALNWAVEQMPQLGKPPRRWWIGGAAAVLALGLVGGWAASRVSIPAPAEEHLLHFQITPPKGPASHLAEVPSLSMSPDGRFLTYGASVNGRVGLWLHPLDGSADRLLTELASAAEPFWSPDSKSVGWITFGQLWRADLSGGEPVAICRGVGTFGDAPVWAADGRILFGSTRGLMQVADSGGTPALLTKVDASLREIRHFHPQLLPDGHLLYWAMSEKAENSALYVIRRSDPSKRTLVTRSTGPFIYAPGGDGKNYILSLNGQALVAREFNLKKLTLGPPRTLLNQPASMLQPAAASLGGALLYAGGSNASRLMWLDRAGKTLEVLSEADRQATVRISPDGKRFVTVRGQYPEVRGNDVWLMSLERHVLSLFVPAVRELTPLARDSNYWSALWSPDSGTVLLDRGRFVFRKAIAASGEGERIAEWPALRRLCDWSRDGRYLLYETSDPETRRDLWVAPVTPDGRLAEGVQPKPYLHGPFAEWHGRFSPDVRWVAYQSDETGRDEIYLASFPDAKRRLQVTSDGGTFPEWGPDGHELFYISGDGMLTVVGLKSGPEGLEPSAPQRLFPVAADFYFANPYEVSPDGKRILLNQGEQNRELHVVVNWPLLLRGQAAQ